MASVIARKSFKLLNPDVIARNWDTNLAATDIAYQHALKHRNTIAQAINHLSGYSPRVLYHAFGGDDYSGAGNTWSDSVIASWLWPDYWKPGDVYSIRILAYTDGDSVPIKLNGSSDTQVILVGKDGSNIMEEMIVQHTVADSESSAYLTLTSNGNNEITDIISIVVQELPRSLLISGNSHPGVYRIAKDTNPIIASHFDECRSTLHSIWEKQNPTVFNWSSYDEDKLATRTTQEIQNYGYVVTTNASKVNIFDMTSTSKTNATPGIFVPAYGCGIGSGTTVRMHCRVRAKNYNFSAGDTGEIRFLGPNNSTNIEVDNSHSSFQWLGDSTNYVTLNTDSDWNDTTVGTMNKVDILANLAQASTGIQIAGISCWLELVP